VQRDRFAHKCAGLVHERQGRRCRAITAVVNEIYLIHYLGCGGGGGGGAMCVA